MLVEYRTWNVRFPVLITATVPDELLQVMVGLSGVLSTSSELGEVMEEVDLEKASEDRPVAARLPQKLGLRWKEWIALRSLWTHAGQLEG
jgi:hypothetical protein